MTRAATIAKIGRSVEDYLGNRCVKGELFDFVK